MKLLDASSSAHSSSNNGSSGECVASISPTCSSSSGEPTGKSPTPLTAMSGVSIMIKSFTVRCLLGQGTEQTRTGGLHTLYSLLHQDEVHPWFHHFHHCPYPWLSRRNRQIHFPLRPQRYA